MGKMAANSLDPLNLVHKGGSVMSNIFTPWKGGKSGAGDTTPLPTTPTTATPVTMTDPSVISAQDNYAKMMGAKNSFARTIHAGDDGGFMGKRFTGQGATTFR